MLNATNAKAICTVVIVQIAIAVQVVGVGTVSNTRPPVAVAAGIVENAIVVPIPRKK